MSNSIVTAIQIQEIEGQLLVDSRLIAERLGIQHRSFYRTLVKHSSIFEKRFGRLRFEIATLETPGGVQQVSFVMLTEPQATFAMTLSRNTPEVIGTKADLVEAFEKAKEVIKTVIPAQNEQLEAMRLQVEILRAEKDLAMLKGSLVTLHGAELALRLMGDRDALVERETVVTEIVQPEQNKSTKVLTADQLKRAVKERTGQNIKSMAEFARALRAAGRDDLLVPVTRHQTCEYVAPESLDEAIAVVYAKSRQSLVGEQYV